MTGTIDLTAYRGRWVAMKGGRLLGHAATAVAIIDFLRSLGGEASGAEAWYEAHPEEVQRWAVRTPDGRICPNCRFYTREEAECGLQWLRGELPDGVVVTRDGQHDPWRPVDEGVQP